jgi:hypothetical protein
MAVEFLHHSGIKIAVSDLLQVPTGDICIAVAFWGLGSSTLLLNQIGGESRGRLKVLCDLMSGACNPAEIESLIRNGVKVKTVID